MLDHLGHYVRWNKYQRDVIVGKPDSQMPLTNALVTIHPEDRSMIAEKISNVLVKGMDETVEGRVLLHGGPEFQWMLMTGRRIIIADKPFLLGFGIDITDRKHLESQVRQAQKLKSIGQLAGGVAHDFNNILAAMMMQINILQQNPSLERIASDALNDLMDEAQRAANLTRQLLMFSRQSVLDIKTLDMNKVVSNLLKMLARLIGEDIKIFFTPRTDLPLVDADPGMMEQVIMNLCVNARDAMPKGGKLIIMLEGVYASEAQTKPHLGVKPGLFLRITVSDTGCGIDKGALQHIFEPFFTTKAVGKGTGLGLSTVHGIIGQHKGWIEVESQIGCGTTFHIFLPATSKRIIESNQDDALKVIKGDETVLLVEDEISVRRALAQSMRLLGYQVFEAGNGPEAMRIWKENSDQIHLLLTDMVMPEGMTGLDLAEKIRKEKTDLKIIISSGYNTKIDSHDSLERAGITYLQKPYEFETLSKALRDCLDRN